VVWSKAIGRADGEVRGTGLLFQSGLEFSKMTAEVQKLLTAYLEAEGTPPPDWSGEARA
jgi:hypothetical protein